MIMYTTGDLLQSSAQALVNTVNCEGYMGKGIAYQFKLQFPENNKDYIKICKKGALKPGVLHHYFEKDKIIINFPTKNKWREKSRMEYIDRGMDSLAELIAQLDIQSIAIPPLGSGNGGLNWEEVKQLLAQKLHILPEAIEIYIYEPSENYVSKTTSEPKLNVAALALMEIKRDLQNFDKARLQKAAYFMDIFLGQNYFNFKRHKYEPYSNPIAVISRDIKEFQDFHGVKNTDEAYTILYKKIVSDNVTAKLEKLRPSIKKACDYVNTIESDHELECLTTIMFLIEENSPLSEEAIVQMFNEWSKEKAARFEDAEIRQGIDKLYTDNIIEKNLMGYAITTQ